VAAPVVNFTAASTPDADPTNPPFKVSREPGKTELTYEWEITFTGKIGFWQERLGGSSRIGGTRLRSLGVVTGLGLRCGHPEARILGATSSPQSRNRSLDIEGDLPSEGDYRFGVDALNHTDEWSATT
jgi:hypothetical protein